MLFNFIMVKYHVDRDRAWSVIQKILKRDCLNHKVAATSSETAPATSSETLGSAAATRIEGWIEKLAESQAEEHEVQKKTRRKDILNVKDTKVARQHMPLLPRLSKRTHNRYHYAATDFVLLLTNDIFVATFDNQLTRTRVWQQSKAVRRSNCHQDHQSSSSRFRA